VIAVRSARRLVAAASVAAAAAALAGPGAASAADGGQVWSTAGCGACHTLNVAGTRARVGPNLDELAPTAARVAAKVRSGGGGMPSFSTKLAAADIDAVAAFVTANAGRLPGQPPVNGTIVAASTGPLPDPAPWVKSLQAKLATLGLFSGAQTGVYGPVTTAAVRAFQVKAGLTPDGKWGPASQTALDRSIAAGKVVKAGAKTKAAATTTTATTVTTTATTTTATAAAATSTTALPPPADWVRTVQQQLATLGFFNGAATGVYGPLTTTAVRAFQTNVGLTPDGKWGPASQTALDAALARSSR
jgi:peptidoglycan hydrolase-like protein with peptidoglycan-binding domain